MRGKKPPEKACDRRNHPPEGIGIEPFLRLIFHGILIVDGRLSDSASRPNLSISSNFYQENMTRQLRRETSLFGQQIDHNQSDHPREQVHKHDMFEFPITPYIHDCLPGVQSSVYRLHELLRPHVTFIKHSSP